MSLERKKKKNNYYTQGYAVCLRLFTCSHLTTIVHNGIIATMKTIVEMIHKAVLPCMQHSPAFTMSEGAVKIAIVDYLLRVGYIILEGAQNGAKAVCMVDKGIHIMPAAALRQHISTSPDIRIIHPVSVVIELQTRSSIGSQDTLASANIADDIERVDSGRADLFVMTVDGGVYDKMMGKRGNRGRKPLHGTLIPDMIGRSYVKRIPTSFGMDRYLIVYGKEV